jgi:hypothetical protein
VPKPASRALTFVYVGDIERILELFACVENLLPHNLQPPDLDVIARLKHRAARTRAAIDGLPVPTKPEAEDRLPE